MMVYPASKVRPHIEMWRALRAVGVPIRASWLDAPFNMAGEEPTADAWARHWQVCCDEAAATDILLLYAHDDDRPQLGSLVEAGAALGAGRQVYCVSPHKWSFRHHPRCRNFDSIDQAVAAITARSALDTQ
jgi:hypothetical protein